MKRALVLLLVLVVAASVLATGCAASTAGRLARTEASDSPRPTYAPTSTTPATFAPSGPAAASTATPPIPAAVGDDPQAELEQLAVRPESSSDGYQRARFGGGWIDADGNGCDTRCEVLEAERRTDLPGLAEGWLSPYDGYSTSDPGELDIDHVVALAEAWRSGADGWDDARRLAFANDLADPDPLVAVTAATNRSKSDKDPAAWQPPSLDDWCGFAAAWIDTKSRWGLSADEAEVRALRNMLTSRHC